MEFDYIFVICGCLLGAVQIAAGVAIGLWIRRGAGALRRRTDARQAQHIAKELQILTDDVSNCVGEHISSVTEATHLLEMKSDSNGQVPADLVVGVVSEILTSNRALQTKLASAESRLHQQAAEIEAYMSRSVTDALTGLPNRRGFDEQLDERLTSWRKEDKVFSLLLLDVDHFKKLNDKHGHLAGDRVLAEVGRVLRDVLRQEDTVARYGGEEFAMLLPGTTIDNASVVLKKVLEAVAGCDVCYEDVRLAITTSGGLATIVPGDNEDSLVSRADEALYAAKNAGRRRAYMHDGKNCLPVTGCITLATEVSSEARDMLASTPLVNVSAWFSQTLLEDPEALISEAETDPISAELAQSCDDLRRCIKEQQWQLQTPA